MIASLFLPHFISIMAKTLKLAKMKALIKTLTLKIYYLITFIILFFIGISNVNAQYANAEISSGGFSFVPAFTDTNP